MSQQQPGWANQQQQPGWGAPPPAPPQTPKKRSAGKVLGLGCLGIVGVFILIAIVGVMASGGKDDAKAGSKNTDNTSGKAKAGSNDAKSADTALFKVWGTAPAGALGGLDIGYGSNSDTRKGTFKNGKFEATVPMTDGAMYYSVTAQLQGSGDINCSVTVDEKTRTGHASGGYNICSAQLSSDFTGDWR